MPADHEGRNSWLLNYGTGPDVDELRKQWEKISGRPFPPGDADDCDSAQGVATLCGPPIKDPTTDDTYEKSAPGLGRSSLEALKDGQPWRRRP